MAVGFALVAVSVGCGDGVAGEAHPPRKRMKMERLDDRRIIE
jgi:hypothetical protein